MFEFEFRVAELTVLGGKLEPHLDVLGLGGHALAEFADVLVAIAGIDRVENLALHHRRQRVYFGRLCNFIGGTVWGDGPDMLAGVAAAEDENSRGEGDGKWLHASTFVFTNSS